MNSEVIDLLGTNTVYYNATATKSIFQTNFPTSHDEIGSYLINGEIPLLLLQLWVRRRCLKNIIIKNMHILLKIMIFLLGRIKEEPS